MGWLTVVVAAWGMVIGVRAEARLLGPYWSWLELTTWHWPDHAPYRTLRRNALIRRFSLVGLVAFVLLYVVEDATILDAVGTGLVAGSILVWPALSDPEHSMVKGHRRWLLYGLFVLFVCVAAGLGGWVAEESLARGGIWSVTRDQALELILGFAVGALAVASLDRAATAGQIQYEVRTSPYETRLPRSLERKLRRVAGSATVWRWARTVTDEVEAPEEQRSLIQLLIAETEARRSWQRSGEWLTVAMSKFSRIRAARTRGPFQMSNAPWSRHEAVRLAATRLRACAIDLDDQAALARCWHGASEQQPGEPTSYRDVLEYCRPIARDIVSALRPDRI